MNYASCKHCGREIVWIRTLEGVNVAFERASQLYTFDVVLAAHAPVLRIPPEPLFMRHSQVCAGDKTKQLRELANAREKIERLERKIARQEPPTAHGPD